MILTSQVAKLRALINKAPRMAGVKIKMIALCSLTSMAGSLTSVFSDYVNT